MSKNITREGGFIVQRENGRFIKSVRISAVSFTSLERETPDVTYVGTSAGHGARFDCSPDHIWNLIFNWETR